MKIIRLTASNIKRLHAVEITPDGALVTIAGKNAQGKSSVLDSIEYALGGEKHIPSEPIRKGEKAAQTEIDLGDIIVTRKFRREHLECDCGQPYKPSHTKDCASNKFGETRSSLFVRSKDGLQYPSPQAVLNKLIGQLTFDPLAFVNADSLVQVHMLRSVVKLDTKELDSERGTLYSERTILNRQLNAETVKFESMPLHAKEGLKPVSLDEITAELTNARTAQETHSALKEKMRQAEYNVSASKEIVKTWKDRIAELETQLKAAKTGLSDSEKQSENFSREFTKISKLETEAMLKLVDTDDIVKRMSEMSETNSRINQNVKRKEQEARVAALKKQVEGLTDDITAIDDAKKNLVESVKYPVDGLGFDSEKDEVTFNGLPFEQASRAEQLRVSIAIGLAINPRLRVLLIKEGSSLDAEGMKLIAQEAEKANAQLWVERVAETKDGAMVMIEDGAVV